jgi:hypothetical protein
MDKYFQWFNNRRILNFGNIILFEIEILQKKKLLWPNVECLLE